MEEIMELIMDIKAILNRPTTKENIIENQSGYTTVLDDDPFRRSSKEVFIDQKPFNPPQFHVPWEETNKTLENFCKPHVAAKTKNKNNQEIQEEDCRAGERNESKFSNVVLDGETLLDSALPREKDIDIISKHSDNISQQQHRYNQEGNNDRVLKRKKKTEVEEPEIERVRLKARRKDAVTSYQSLLTERIKDCEASWTESRPKLEKDPLGRATNSDLDQAERERLFHEYVNGLYERYVREYRSLLADVITMDAATKHLEDGKNILTSWSEAKRLLKPDQRYARMPRRERELWWRRYAEDVQRRVKAIPSYTERRSIFEHYVRTRADEERKEKRAAQKAAVEGFKQLLDEASEDITYKTDYENFAKKWGDDHRFEALDRKERESLLNERVLPLRRALEEKVKAIQAASTASFKAMLRNRGDITSGSRWSKVKDSLRSDSRYKAVKREDREALFNEYVDEKRAAEQEAERAAEAKRDEEEKLKERKREMLKRKEREEHEMERMTGGRYSIVEKLGSGSFGEVYKGIDVETEENAAIKMERKDAKHPQLFHDSKIYEHISDGIGIPNIRWRGTKIDHSILVLDLLGPSLGNIFGYRQCKFNLKMVLMLADQLIERIEYIYRRSVLHRDLKLDDLLMGISLTSKLVHLNDFGLSKLFQNSNSMRHIPLTTHKGLTRTVHYASINNHRGIEQSRRDDIESIGYALLYFLRGNLPWQDVMDSNKKRKFENICEMKMATPIEYLCYEDDNVFEWTPMLKRHRLQNSRAGVPGPLPPVESESSSPSVTPPPLPLEAFPLLKDINFPMTNDFKRYNDQFMMFRGRNILKSEAM